MGLIGQEVEPLALAARIDEGQLPLTTSMFGNGKMEQRWPTMPRSQRPIGWQLSGPERGRAVQGPGEPNRDEVPDNRGSEPGPPSRQPLQAMAGLLQ